MDKINIDNLFSTDSNKKNPLDVYSLYNHYERKVSNNIKFNIDKLINAKEEKKRKVFQHYRKIYNVCLNKIDIANSIRKTDIIYDVPLYIYRCEEYNIVECLEYLEEKLRDIYMDTLIVPPSSIFISWTNIEDNKNNSDKEH